MDAFTFQAAGDFSSFDKGAQSAWDRAQGYISKRPIKLRIEDNASQPLGRITAGVGNFDRALDAATKRVLTFGIVAKSFAKLEEGVNSFVRSAIDVQSALTRINVGLGQSQKGLETFSSSLFNIARNTGQSFDDTAKAAERLSKQNLGLAETTKRLQAVMTLTRVAGIDSVSAVNALTSTLATFKKEGLTASDVIDKLTVANNKFGVSGENFTEAIQRSGLVAQQAGVGFNQLLGIITAVQKVTGRDGAAIGTSINKVLAGLEQPATREKLNSYGINTKDARGNQLGGLDVLTNVAVKFQDKNFSSNDKANVNEVLSGQRQEENTLALLNELGKKYGLVTQAAGEYANAQGAGASANDKLNTSLQSLIKSAGTSFSQLSSRIGQGSVSPAISQGVGILDTIRKSLSSEDQGGSKTGEYIGDGIIKGIINVLSGPGVVIVGKILALALGKTLSFAKDDLKGLIGLNDATQKRASIQSQVNNLLKQASQQDLQAIENATTLLSKKNAILAAVININRAQESSVAAANAVAGSFGPTNIKTLFKGKNGKGFAEGHIPAVMNEISDISHGVGGASSSAKPVVIPNFNFGGGHIGSAVANTDEYIVPNFAGGGDAIFNKSMVAKYGVPGGAKHLAGGYVPNFAGGDLDSREAALRGKGFNASSSEFYNLNKGGEGGGRGSISGKQREILQRILIEYGESTKVGIKLQNQLNKGLERAAKFLSEDSLADVKSIIQKARAPSGVFGVGESKKAGFNSDESREFGGLAQNSTYVSDEQRASSSAKKLAAQRDRENKAIYAKQLREEKIGKYKFGASIALPLLAGFLPEGQNDTAGGAALGGLKGGIEGAATGSLFGPLGTGIGAVVGATLGVLSKLSTNLDQASEEAHEKNKEIHDKAGQAKSDRESKQSVSTEAGRRFLGPKDFLDYTSKSAENFGRAGANTKLLNFDTSRNGSFSTATQRAKNNVDFYKQLEEQLPGTDLSNDPNFVKNRQIVQKNNAFNAAGRYLQERNPSGRYFDRNGEPISNAISQGLTYQKGSSNKDVVAQASLLETYINASQIDTPNNGASAFSKSRANAVGNLQSIDNALDPRGKLDLRGGKFGLDKDTQEQINQLDKIADKLNQAKQDAIHVIELRVTNPKEQGYGYEKGTGNTIIDGLVNAITKLTDEFNKSQGKPNPPRSAIPNLGIIGI